MVNFYRRQLSLLAGAKERIKFFKTQRLIDATLQSSTRNLIVSFYQCQSSQEVIKATVQGVIQRRYGQLEAK